jgi:hypothetical protein
LERIHVPRPSLRLRSTNRNSDARANRQHHRKRLVRTGRFAVWGWRVPFALSIFLVGIGLWIRLGILETPVFQKLLDDKKVEKAPSFEVTSRSSRPEIILSALVRKMI